MDSKVNEFEKFKIKNNMELHDMKKISLKYLGSKMSPMEEGR